MVAVGGGWGLSHLEKCSVHAEGAEPADVDLFDLLLEIQAEFNPHPSPPRKFPTKIPHGRGWSQLYLKGADH